MRLSNIQPDDFKDLARALELYRQATKCGLMPDSENARLKWVAAIERARTVPAQNPAGVFLFIIKNKKWDYLSDGHYFAAHERLKAHLFGTRTVLPSMSLPIGDIGCMSATPSYPPRSPRTTLGKDALLVRTIRGLLAQRGIKNHDLLPLLRRDDPTWTRVRLDAAELELRIPNFMPEAR